jgi:hypothetical protein
MTSKTLNRYNSTTPLLTKNFKIMYSSKKVSGVYFVKYFYVKKGVLGNFRSSRKLRVVIFTIPGAYTLSHSTRLHS